MPYFVGGLVIIAVLLHLTPFDVLINRRRNAGATPAAHVSVSADCAGAVTVTYRLPWTPQVLPQMDRTGRFFTVSKWWSQ